MSFTTSTKTKAELKEKLYKKARVAAEPPRKSNMKSSTAKAKVSRSLHATISSPKKTQQLPKPKKDNKGKSKAVIDLDHEDTAPALPSSFKIIAGSYEKLLYGLEGTVSVEEESHKYILKPMFIFPAHMSYIRAVAASPSGGKWLATGSGDEIIKVWDLRRRREIGGLMQHEGTLYDVKCDASVYEYNDTAKALLRT
jgi:protein MAK11